MRNLARFLNLNTAVSIPSQPHPAFGHPLPRGEGLGVREQPQRNDAHANLLMWPCLVVLFTLSFAASANPVQVTQSASATPISIHPKNPKYFLFRGKPLALITATEHYGSVVNSRFDFERYLQDAADKKQTLTRLFLLFREQQSQRNPYSPLKVESPDFLTPYLRTGPGKALDGEPQVQPRSVEPRLFCQAPPISRPRFGVGHRCGSDPLQQYLRQPGLGAQSAPF